MAEVEAERDTRTQRRNINSGEMRLTLNLNCSRGGRADSSAEWDGTRQGMQLANELGRILDIGRMGGGGWREPPVTAASPTAASNNNGTRVNHN